MCPWCQFPFSLGPCIWQERQRESWQRKDWEKQQQKKQADKLESEQMNDVCLYAQRKWLIMWLTWVCARMCVCNAACIWLWGSCPRGEAQLKPAWHQSSVLVPWLTGCANRKRTGRTHTRSCVCVGNATLCPSLSKPNSTWVCDANLPATLSQCRRGHRQRGGRRRGFWRVLLLQFKSI